MMTQHLEPGLYFGLDEEIYHALPYLSASGIKNLLISPMNFWAWSWMNPTKPERDSDAMDIGKAYHKRILEGAEAYHEQFTVQFDPDQYPDALRTNADLVKALRARGLAVGGNKDVLIQRLKASDPSAVIYEDIYQDWVNGEAMGKTVLSQDVMDRIEIAAAMIENHPELRKCFQGGYPEATVIWEEHGIRFKSRFDYLKTRAITDLKTFENKQDKPVDRAIYYAMASHKYHIQAAFYMGRAARQAAAFAKEGRVFGCMDKAFLAKLAQSEAHDFYFVFQQKGVAPVARGKKFPRGLMFGCGEQAIEDAIRKFKECLQTYGTAPWVDPTPIDSFEDEQFPVFATEL